jgi:hypothetical protein
MGKYHPADLGLSGITCTINLFFFSNGKDTTMELLQSVSGLPINPGITSIRIVFLFEMTQKQMKVNIYRTLRYLAADIGLTLGV